MNHPFTSYPVDIKEEGEKFVLTFEDFPQMKVKADTYEKVLEKGRKSLIKLLSEIIRNKQQLPVVSPPEGKKVITLPALVALKLILYREMTMQGVNKASLARRLKWHGPQIDRLLDLYHQSRMDQLEAAFNAFGKKVTVGVTGVVR